MSLTLEIVGPQAAQLGAAARKIFLRAGGSIGRASANDWVIPDAYVSGQHARVHFHDGRYFLEDTSTNGVFIKNPGNRLPKGQQYPLHTGDRVFIDAYEIKVTIDGESDLPASSRPSLFDAVNKQNSVVATAALENPRKRTARPEEINGIPVDSTIPLPEPSDAIVDAAALERVEALEALDASQSLPEIDFDPFGDESQSGLNRIDEGIFAAAAAKSESPPPRLSKTSKSSKRVPAKSSLPLNNSESDHYARPDISASMAGKQAVDIQALLASAGLNQTSITPEMADSFGRILQVVIAGVMQMLQTREQVRAEFGVRNTSYKKADNNPLKFSVNVEDALHNLLVKRNAAYLKPVEAFEDAFRDMQYHELAMLEAMRAAYNSMLQHFNPDALQVNFNKEVKQGSLWSGPIKLRYWDLYRDRFKSQAQDADQCFRDLFADEFVKVYSARLEQMKQANKKL
ncbi:MAG TPA: type VI secretion system-associated FHA domain protein TagH [Steroidobacteraceae bacterium]|nr:type VI secretion system-associated FHA domain protein TagH [Steroidobacteraceae bacterium]